MSKHIVTYLAASALVLGAGAPATAQEATVYKPAGQWALDYGDDYCRLMRTFSDGQNELSLAFERIQPGPMMRMILVGDGIRTYRSASELGWNFAPAAGEERKARYAQSETADGKGYFNLGSVSVMPMPGFGPASAQVRRDFSRVPSPAPESSGSEGPRVPPAYDRQAEQAAAKPLNAIQLGSGLLRPVRIETGSLEAPVGALQACADDLVKTWGVDPAKLADKGVPAIPEGGGVGWLPQGTIPFDQFGKLAGESNQVRLLVDAGGKPTSCHIHWPTLGDSLNKRICSTLMDKAKFVPAKDSEGNAMPGYWIGSPMFLGPPMPGGRRPG